MCNLISKRMIIHFSNLDIVIPYGKVHLYAEFHKRVFPYYWVMNWHFQHTYRRTRRKNTVGLYKLFIKILVLCSELCAKPDIERLVDLFTKHCINLQSMLVTTMYNFNTAWTIFTCHPNYYKNELVSVYFSFIPSHKNYRKDLN